MFGALINNGHNNRNWTLTLNYSPLLMVSFIHLACVSAMEALCERSLLVTMRHLGQLSRPGKITFLMEKIATKFIWAQRSSLKCPE